MRFRIWVESLIHQFGRATRGGREAREKGVFRVNRVRYLRLEDQFKLSWLDRPRRSIDGIWLARLNRNIDQ